MGLTVHYSLRLFDRSARLARRLVEKLHRRAQALPFLRVGPIWRLKDALPGEVTAPIMQYPDFEHLEARGGEKQGSDRRRS